MFKLNHPKKIKIKKSNKSSMINKNDFSISKKLFERQIGGKKTLFNSKIWSNSIIDDHLEHCDTFHYVDLLAHYGCVNSIEFSPDGQFLISGGDDQRVLLWHVWDSILADDYKPQEMLKQHNSNIFCLSFDQQMQRIFSGGNDELVIVHDIKTCDAINVFSHAHDVYGISVDPTNNNVFASASNEVAIWDLRNPTDQLKIKSDGLTFHSVMYNPQQANLITISSSKNGIEIFDTRQPDKVLRGFYPHNILGGQSAMCARFNSAGNKILGLGRKLPPVLYDIRSPYPQLLFDGDGFFNQCTLKNCSFAGQNDQFVMTGSDNFFVYLWRIPDEIHNDTNVKKDSINYVLQPSHVLNGHRSIVNQVRFNNRNGFIASAGVEKMIRLWSPLVKMNESDSINSHKPRFSRRFFSYPDFVSGLGSNTERTLEENIKLIAYFDSIMDRDVAFSSASSSNDDDPPSFYSLQNAIYFLKENNLRTYLDYDTESFVSDHEDKFSLQNFFFLEPKKFRTFKSPVFRFHSSSSESDSEIEYKYKLKFEASPKEMHYLDMVYAKRMHTKYLISILDYLTQRISLILPELKQAIANFELLLEKSKHSRKNPHIISVLLYKAKKREEKNYKNLFIKIQFKKKASLLFKAYRFVTELYVRLRADYLFRMDRLASCNNIRMKKILIFFSQKEQMKLLIRRNSVIPDEKLFDKKLNNLITQLFDKAVKLATILRKELNMNKLSGMPKGKKERPIQYFIFPRSKSSDLFKNLNEDLDESSSTVSSSDNDCNNIAENGEEKKDDKENENHFSDSSISSTSSSSTSSSSSSSTDFKRGIWASFGKHLENNDYFELNSPLSTPSSSDDDCLGFDTPLSTSSSDDGSESDNSNKDIDDEGADAADDDDDGNDSKSVTNKSDQKKSYTIENFLKKPSTSSSTIKIVDEKMKKRTKKRRKHQSSSSSSTSSALSGCGSVNLRKKRK